MVINLHATPQFSGVAIIKSPVTSTQVEFRIFEDARYNLQLPGLSKLMTVREDQVWADPRLGGSGRAVDSVTAAGLSGNIIRTFSKPWRELLALVSRVVQESDLSAGQKQWLIRRIEAGGLDDDKSRLDVVRRECSFYLTA